MHLFREVFVLFSLNLIDAILTLVWVRTGIAPEGNQLMAGLMEIGDFAFIGVKIMMGTIVAVVILRWGGRHQRLARVGITVALSVYFCVMGVHALTYLQASGYLSSAPIPAVPAVTDAPPMVEFARASL